MSIPRLFHVAVAGFVHSRAFRCIWLLEELGVQNFEVCMLETGTSYASQMKNYGIQHSFKLPTLQIGHQEITESSVISQVLAEKYQHSYSLLGTPEERIEMLQWLAMSETCITFRIPLLPTLLIQETSLTELKSNVIQPVRETFQKNTAIFESHFVSRGSDYLLDSGFSIADTMCGWSLFTFNEWGLMDLTQGDTPQTLAYLNRLKARPAFQLAEKYSNTAPGIYGRGCIPIA